jgi:hypothetical protein
MQPVICADPSSLGISVADPDPSVEVRIRLWILLSWSKNCKKNLDSYCFVTCSFAHDFLSLKNDVDVPSKSNKEEN